MADPTIQDVIDYIQGTLMPATVSTLVKYTDEPPEKIKRFPATVCFVRSADWKVEPADVLKGSPVTIALQLHVARKDLERDTQKVMPFSVLVPREIWDTDDLNGTVDTIQAVRQTRFGELNWGDEKTFGIEWEIDVKFTCPLNP